MEKFNSYKSQNVGLFFGSFNPVHVGHMIIANHVLNSTNLDQVWMVVTPHNPLKVKNSLAPDYDRLRMVELAIGDNSKIRASNIEFSLPKPSYTIDTLTYLKEKYPKKSFSLIMGADNISTIDKWKNYIELLSNYTIIVYNRIGSASKVPENIKDNYNIQVVDAPLLDISSTYIRNLIAQNKSCRYFVDDEVFKYINDRALYSD